MKQSLHLALQQLQALHVPIRLTARSVALWSPNTRVPGALRTVVREHRAEIRSMIRACRIEVCPSQLHRHEWYFADPEWRTGTAVCAICQRLAMVGDPVASKDNYSKISCKREQVAQKG